MRADIVPLTFRDACYVAANIREQDWKECRCQMWEEDKVALAQLCFFGSPEGLRWCARLDGQPVSALGVVASGPLRYSLWMWSTKRLLRVFPAIVKFLDVQLRDELVKRNANRLEIYAYEGHDFVQRGWLSKAGAVEVCDLPSYGKNGENFKLFAWWKGMPNGQDIRYGYTRVRGLNSHFAVRPRVEDGQLRDDGLRPHERSLSIHVDVVSDGVHGLGRRDDSDRSTVQLDLPSFRPGTGNTGVCA